MVMFRGANAMLEEGLRLEWSANKYLMGTKNTAEGHKAFAKKKGLLSCPLAVGDEEGR
jgi:hypothetical protein